MPNAEFGNAELPSPEPGDPDPRGSRSAGVRARGRKLAVSVGVLAIGAALAIVGFGSLAGADDTSGTGNSGSSAVAPHSFPRLTPDQQTCLENALGDVKLPGAGSAPALPTQDQVKDWIGKLKDAMKTCGVTLPTGGSSGRGSGFLGLTAEQQTCLKNALGDVKLPGAGSAPALSTQDQVKDWIGKLKDAMKTCGVTLPTGGSSGRGSGFLGLTAEQQTCLKNALGDVKLPGAGSAPALSTQDQVKDWIGKLKDAMKTCGVTLPTGDSGLI